MKSILSILIMLFTCSICITAQTDKELSTKINEAVEEMSEKDKAELLGLIIALDDNVDKKLKKSLKKLSKEEKEFVYNNIKIMSLKGNIETAQASPPVEEAAGPTTSIEFSEKEYNFGEVTSGEKVKYIYKFKNTGNEPLVISGARGSCGCTVPKWPREPIAPGKKGEIEVVFDTKNKQGRHTKTITITANTTPSNSILTIKGEVKKAESPE